MSRIVYILRGCPGSGKTKLAETLCATTNLSSIICSTDDYFIHNDKYVFDNEQLSTAHNWCMKLYEEAISDDTDIIVISNTNTKVKDIRVFQEKAIENNYTVFVIIVENRHNNKNIHDVPDEKIKRMEQAIKSNIKLT